MRINKIIVFQCIFCCIILSCKIENKAPFADFTVEPESGNTETLFTFDASYSVDEEDNNSDLYVRWDVDNNGIWDSEWTTVKIYRLSYQISGKYTIVLEVKDSKGLSDASMKELNVDYANKPPSIPSEPFPENNSNDIGCKSELRWLSSDPEGENLIFDIYFGISPNPRLVETNWESFVYKTDSLIPGESYYWRINAKDNSGNVTEGPLWFFITGIDSVELSFTDPRDDKTYRMVEIGDQFWMTENLNYVTSFGSFCYDQNSIYCNKMHRLYNWETAKTSCPPGWHLPSDEEWKELEMDIGMLEDAADSYGLRGTIQGRMIKSTSDWKNGGNGTNEMGFSILPAGQRSFSEEFILFGESATFWTSTSFSDWDAWVRELYYDKDGIYRVNYHNKMAFSVRCIRN